MNCFSACEGCMSLDDPSLASSWTRPIKITCSCMGYHMCLLFKATVVIFLPVLTQVATPDGITDKLFWKLSSCMLTPHTSFFQLKEESLPFPSNTILHDVQLHPLQDYRQLFHSLRLFFSPLYLVHILSLYSWNTIWNQSWNPTTFLCCTKGTCGWWALSLIFQKQRINFKSGKDTVSEQKHHIWVILFQSIKYHYVVLHLPQWAPRIKCSRITLWSDAGTLNMEN